MLAEVLDGKGLGRFSFVGSSVAGGHSPVFPLCNDEERFLLVPQSVSHCLQLLPVILTNTNVQV